MIYDIAYMWSLKNDIDELTYTQNRNRPTDIENKLTVNKGKGGCKLGV